MFPVAAKAPFHHIGLLAIGHADIDQAYRLLFRAAAGTGDAGNAKPKGGGCLAPNPLRQGPGDLLADRAVSFNQRRRNTGEKGLRAGRYKPPLRPETIANCR